MLAHFPRVMSFRLLAVLLTSTALPAVAQQAPSAAATTTGPLSAASRTEPAPTIVLPEVPGIDPVVKIIDVTGSIGSHDAAPRGPTEQLTLPPSLPFDDQPLPVAPNLPPPPAGTAASLSDAASPTHPAASADGPTASTPDSAVAQVPQGLDAAALTTAIATFATEPVGTDTPAQASERHKVREDIAAFYAGRGYAPLWIEDGHLTQAARAVLARLDHAGEDGLDLRRFAVPMPRSGDTAVLLRAELGLSEAVMAYGRQATGSRVDVARLGGIIDLRPDVADAARVLGTVPVASDPGEALQAFNPPQPGYVALRQKLAELRQRSTPDAISRIPPGPVLKTGMSDARVPLIRARFGLDVASDDPKTPGLIYDTKVAAAVAQFQRSKGLRASGELTPRTIAALSGGNPSRLENLIVANMEGWRWLPRDLGPDHVEVNVPEYEVRMVRDGAVSRESRVVVGQPDKPTPIFSQSMRFIIVNPYWNVPLSIIKKEMMPKLAADPNYFQSHGYEVIERNGTTYVRQPPGDGNALGRIKFMFPNQHSVYLHDTNARSFFSHDRRALSHGCVRVDNPFGFAEAVLGPENGWSEARIKKLIGGQERTINLPHPLPIHIMYFTAFVDPVKGFQVRDDVYGYTGRVKVALGLQD